MSQFVILDPETLGVTDWYFADSLIVPVTPGITLPVPEGLSWSDVKGVQAEDGSVTLTEDPAKLEDHKATLWSQLRTERNRRLAASDWTQLPDARVDKDAWVEYRQKLRDLPGETQDPASPEWPTTPTN